MPIRFACPTCEQRLSVGSHKAGQTAVCPKCKATLAIPAGDEPPPEVSEGQATAAPEPPPIENGGTSSPSAVEAEPPLFDFEGGVEIVYATPAVAPRRPARKRGEEPGVDFDRISLPRYVLFVQGVLLAGVALACFLLGMAVGGAVSESGTPGPAASTPVTVTGTVSHVDQGQRTPDAGAVVVFLPFDAQPDERGSLIGLRPGDNPTQGEMGRNFVQLLGGRVGRCDQRGQYSVQLPDRGRYFLLVVSASAPPRPGVELAPQEVAQLARFFDLRDDPLAESRVQWRVEPIRDSRNINVNFD